VITYRATLDVPMELLRFVTRLLILERRRRCTPAGSRALTCREQAVMVLRRFRDRTRVEQLGRDHGISRATAYRYVDEGTEVLAARAPDLHEALERAREEGTPFVILDGKLFSTDRLSEQVTSVKGKAIDAWYSGKHHRPGGNVQAVIRPDGLPLWASPAEPGHVHDITAARVHALPALYRAAALGMPTLADSGYEGAGIGIHVPVKSPGGSQEIAPDNQARNSLLRGLRFQGERGFALLTQRWAFLQHTTASPRQLTQIVRAALVLTQFEHKYIR
jgi:DDE superfamily endonuclease